MTYKRCVTYLINFEDLSEAKEIILPILKELKKDYNYLFYDPCLKISVVETSREEIEFILEKLKELNKIVKYIYLEKEVEWDISKIIASAAVQITDYIQRKGFDKENEKLVEFLAKQEDINALAYSPLHFILNQLRMLDKEIDIRLKVLKNPGYLQHCKAVPGITEMNWVVR